MVISPAKAMHHYPTREDNLLVCSTDIDASYMIAFTYPILLIVICTVYAVLTRKIPEAFNESKHIGNIKKQTTKLYIYIIKIFINNFIRFYNVYNVCYMVGFRSFVFWNS